MFWANSRPEGSKITHLESMRQVQKSTGQTPKKLAEQPILDDCLLPTWYAYCDILQGNEKITLRDIKAYCDVYDDPLDQWQIKAILSLDTVRQAQWQTK